jgi:hypothetical protein
MAIKLRSYPWPKLLNLPSANYSLNHEDSLDTKPRDALVCFIANLLTR